MTFIEAEFCINDSRRKLASYSQLVATAKCDNLLAQIREEIVRLEIAAQNLPGRSAKIYRLIQGWRRCHDALWTGAHD